MDCWGCIKCKTRYLHSLTDIANALALELLVGYTFLIADVEFALSQMCLDSIRLKLLLHLIYVINQYLSVEGKNEFAGLPANSFMQKGGEFVA